MLTYKLDIFPATDEKPRQIEWRATEHFYSPGGSYLGKQTRAGVILDNDEGWARDFKVNEAGDRLTAAEIVREAKAPELVPEGK